MPLVTLFSNMILLFDCHHVYTVWAKRLKLILQQTSEKSDKA